MLLSIWPSAQQPWHDLVEVSRHADRTGWHAVYLADHFMGDGGGFGTPETPTFEATGSLAAVAALTSQLRVGSLVLGNTYRHPAVVANWAATVDHVSGGRMVLGVGAGWQVNEHEQYGIELPGPGVRVDRFEESCRVLSGLLHDPPAHVAGEHYRVTSAICEPRPVQEHLPLLIGGKGDRMLGIVARHADRWNMWGLPEVIAERRRVLERRCDAIGRDPGSILSSTQALVLVTDHAARAAEFVAAAAPRAAFAGPASAFSELCDRWAAVGVDEVVVPDWSLGRGAERAAALDALRAAVG